MDTNSLPVTPALLCSARRLTTAIVVLTWIVPLLTLLQYAFSNPANAPDSDSITPLLATVEWTPTRRVIGAAVGFLPIIAIMLALFQLARICREYAEGHLFSNTVLAAYRRLGLSLIAFTLLQCLQPTLLGLALATTLPPGKRFVTLGISSHDLLWMLLTALVFLLGSVMQVAQRIQAENAEIV